MVAVDAFSLKGNFDGKTLHNMSADARTPGNHIVITDASLPISLLQPADLFAEAQRVKARFGIELTDPAAFLQLIQADMNAYPEIIRTGNLAINGNLDRGTIQLEQADAMFSGNHIVITDASLPISLLQTGDLFTAARGAKADFGIEITDFAAVLQLFRADMPLMPEAVRPETITVNGSLDRGKIHLDQADARTTDSHLVITSAVIAIPETQEAMGSAPVSLSAEFNSRNFHEIIGVYGEFPLNGRVNAALNTTGSIIEPQGTIQVSAGDVSYKDLLMGSLALQGEFRATGEKIGTFKKLNLTLNELTQTNDSGAVTLSGPAEISWQPEGLSINAVFRFDEHGAADISVVRNAENAISGKIATRNLSSDGWLKNFISNGYFFNSADLTAVFSGLTEDPQLELTGFLEEVGGKNIAFPLSGKFALHYSDRGIKITDFSWKSHEKNQLSLTGFLPYDPLKPEPFLEGKIILEGHIDFPELEGIGVVLKPLGISGGRLSVDMDISGSWQQPLGHIFLTADRIIPPEFLKQYADSLITVTCDLYADPDAIVLKSINLVSEEYSARANGSWQHGFSVKELLEKRLTELRGDVSADIAVHLKSLNVLKNQLAWLRRFDGDTRAEIKVSGPINNPRLQGLFEMKDGEISHTFNFPMLTSINLQGEFDQQSLTIKSLQGEAGGSPVSFTGRLNRKQPGKIDVSLLAEGNNVLLFRNNDLRMRGNVKLEISGPLDRLTIKGHTGLTDGLYTRNIDFLEKFGALSVPVSKGGEFLFSFQEQPLKNALLDIKITTVEPFRIRNNLVRGTLRPELTLKGTGELPFLAGTIYIDPSRVLLPSGRLQVQSGLVRFPESDPDRPQIDLMASSRVLDYDIQVITHGPIDDPVITLSSSPALPNEDLLLLLLTGQPPKLETIPGTQVQGTTRVMVYLGRDFLNKWLEEDSGSSEESILDRFELDFGRGITKSGEQTIESTFRLSELNEKSRVYYLSGEKDRYDAYNYGLRMVFRFE
ncbi:MAG: translocation/assembly module TamB domain-containing protein [Deltaproteobacteria bacterium]|jgi:hypothetical protein|nr:translocation/assembly module TamB domain-containing protein [Deltaproteobacteria bacterium]